MERQSKESEPKGPGFGLPPKGTLDLNHRRIGVLEYGSIGKSISEHRRVVKMICTHRPEFVLARLLSPSK